MLHSYKLQQNKYDISRSFFLIIQKNKK